jgi:hypothetical protein
MGGRGPTCPVLAGSVTGCSSPGSAAASSSSSGTSAARGSISSTRSPSGDSPSDATRTWTASDAPTHSGAVPPRTAGSPDSAVPGLGAWSSLDSSRCQPDHSPVCRARVRTSTRPLSSARGSVHTTPSSENGSVLVTGSPWTWVGEPPSGAAPPPDRVVTSGLRGRDWMPSTVGDAGTGWAAAAAAASSGTASAAARAARVTLGRRTRIPTMLDITPQRCLFGLIRSRAGTGSARPRGRVPWRR